MSSSLTPERRLGGGVSSGSTSGRFSISQRSFRSLAKIGACKTKNIVRPSEIRQKANTAESSDSSSDSSEDEKTKAKKPSVVTSPVKTALFNGHAKPDAKKQESSSSSDSSDSEDDKPTAKPVVTGKTQTGRKNLYRNKKKKENLYPTVIVAILTQTKKKGKTLPPPVHHIN